MKKMVSISLVCFLLLSLFCIAGCSQQGSLSPEETVSKMFEAIKAQDSSELQKYYSGSPEELLTGQFDLGDSLDATAFEFDTENLENAFEKLREKYVDFDYSIIEAKPADDGKTTNVTVTISTYDFQSIGSNLLGILLEKAMEVVLSGESIEDESVQAELMEEVSEEIIKETEELTEKSVNTELALLLNKTDSGWIIQEADTELLNALSGGWDTWEEEPEEEAAVPETESEENEKEDEAPETETESAQSKAQKHGYDEETNWELRFDDYTFQIPSYFEEYDSDSDASKFVGVLDNDSSVVIAFQTMEGHTAEDLQANIDYVVETTLDIWDESLLVDYYDGDINGYQGRVIHALGQDAGEEIRDVYAVFFVDSTDTLFRIILMQSKNAEFNYFDDYADVVESMASAAIEDEDISSDNETDVSDEDNACLAEGYVGDAYIAVKDWKIVDDYSGEPVLVLTYDWTNNSDETASAVLSVSTKAFQNGISLDTGIVLDDSIDTGSLIREVKPGTTIEVQELFSLQDTESEIEIEITDPWDFFGDPEILSFTIELN